MVTIGAGTSTLKFNAHWNVEDCGQIQTYDAPFNRGADSFTLHDQHMGQASSIRGQAAPPVFDDRRSCWGAAQPFVGVKARISSAK